VSLILIGLKKSDILSFINAFGAFADFYDEEYLKNYSATVISMVGAVQVFLLYICTSSTITCTVYERLEPCCFSLLNRFSCSCWNFRCHFRRNRPTISCSSKWYSDGPFPLSAEHHKAWTSLPAVSCTICTIQSRCCNQVSSRKYARRMLLT
jgi:hypothetical protein